VVLVIHGIAFRYPDSLGTRKHCETTNNEEKKQILSNSEGNLCSSEEFGSISPTFLRVAFTHTVSTKVQKDTDDLTVYFFAFGIFVPKSFV